MNLNIVYEYNYPLNIIKCLDSQSRKFINWLINEKFISIKIIHDWIWLLLDKNNWVIRYKLQDLRIEFDGVKEYIFYYIG